MNRVIFFTRIGFIEMLIRQIDKKKDIPYDLLLLADPSVEQLESYVPSGFTYVLTEDKQIIAAAVLKEIDKNNIELMNISVLPSFQGKKYGKKLLAFLIKEAKENNYNFLHVGTGNSSISQLAFYQKAGFEIQSIDTGYFTRNYPELIYENGIQCKHMLRLVKQLNV